VVLPVRPHYFSLDDVRQPRPTPEQKHETEESSGNWRAGILGGVYVVTEDVL